MEIAQRYASLACGLLALLRASWDRQLPPSPPGSDRNSFLPGAGLSLPGLCPLEPQPTCSQPPHSPRCRVPSLARRMRVAPQDPPGPFTGEL